MKITRVLWRVAGLALVAALAAVRPGNFEAAGRIEVNFDVVWRLQGGQEQRAGATLGVPKDINLDGAGPDDVRVTVLGIGLDPKPDVLFERIQESGTVPRGSVEVELTVTLPTGSEKVRFGFDTTRSGSVLPMRLRGLVTSPPSLTFNPLTVDVSSGGPPTHRGPLALLASATSAGSTSSFRVSFDPLPERVTVDHRTDPDGTEHVTLSRSVVAGAQVDLDADVRTTKTGSTSTLLAAVDRLPAQVVIDLPASSSDDSGSIDVRTTAAPGVPIPDVALQVDRTRQGRTSRAWADVVGLPDDVHAEWTMPDKGDTSFLFRSDGAPVGSIEARVVNFPETGLMQPPVPAFVPGQDQYAAVQSRPWPGDPSRYQQVVKGRAERVREVVVKTFGDGFEAAAKTGDGTKPIQVHVDVDKRTGGESRVLATAVVRPLPEDVFVSVRGRTDTSSSPLTAVYRASRQVDITGTALLSSSPVAVADPKCQVDPGTTCATFRALHVPKRVTARVLDLPERVQLEVDAEIPHRTRVPSGDPMPGGMRVVPELDLDITSLTHDDPKHPLVAHVEIIDLAPSMRMRLTRRSDNSVERVEAHACAWDFEAEPPACAPATQSWIGGALFRVGNVVRRPDLWPDPAFAEPNVLHLVARGRQSWTAVDAKGPFPWEDGGPPAQASTSKDTDFEVFGRISDLRHLDYADVRAPTRISGAWLDAGDGTRDMAVLADVQDVDDPNDAPEAGRVGTAAKLVLRPLQPNLRVCLRSQQDRAGTAPPAGWPAHVALCRADPWAKTDPSTKQPSAVAWSAPVSFGLDADVAYTSSGTDPGIGDDLRLEAEVNAAELPRVGQVLVLTGKRPSDSTRARFVTGTPLAKQVPVLFSAWHLEADAMCADPRPARRAACATGTLSHLPLRGELFSNPEKPLTTGCAAAQNLCVLVDAGQWPLVLTRAELSQVEPRLDSEGKPVLDADGHPMQDARVVAVTKLDLGGSSGQVVKVHGTYTLPTAAGEVPTLALVASPSVPAIDVTYRNFVGPDVLTQPPPRHRPVPDVSIVQRGPDVRARVAATDVRRVVYRQVRKVSTRATNVLSLGFGQGKPVRVYLDVQAPGERGGPLGARLIADLLLEKTPLQTDVCFRGETVPTVALPQQASWCDDPDGDGVPDDYTAYAFTAPAGASLDVDGFFRSAGAGGTQVTAATFDIDGIPQDVKVLVRPGDNLTLDVKASPSAVAGIRAQMASFDLADGDTGYAGLVPYYAERVRPRFAPLPAPPQGTGQHLLASVRHGESHVRLGIGGTGGSGLRSLALSPKPCPAPQGSTDYPSYPEAAGREYRCISGSFQSPSTADPLAARLVFDDARTHVALDRAEISDLPSAFQLTLAKDARTTDLPPCGPGTTSPCSPPLLRFDQSGAGVLSGVLEAGTPVNFATLQGAAGSARPVDLVTPGGVFPNLAADPTTAAWSDWNGSCGTSLPSQPCGVRAKLVGFPSSGTSPDLAVAAAFRITTPASLTVDQVRSWQAESVSPEWSARDLGVHWVAKDAQGQRVPLGEGAVFYADLKKRVSLLLTQGVAPAFTVPDATLRRGFKIPGEFGFTLYDREAPELNRRLIQIDGRTSDPLSVLARLKLAGPQDPVDEVTLGLARAPGVTTSTAPGRPSFRVQFEFVGEPKKTASPPACTATACLASATGADANVTAMLDLNTGTPTRLVQALVRVDGAMTHAVEIAGFGEVDGGQPRHMNGVFRLEAPLNVSEKAVILSGVGDARVNLNAVLDVKATLRAVKRFVARHNLLHVQASVDPPSIASKLGPVTLDVRWLHAHAATPLGLLLGVDMLPPGTITPVFVNCPVSGASGVGTVELDRTVDAVAWPGFDPRIVTTGTLSKIPGFRGIVALLGPALCLSKLDAELMLSPSGERLHPTDPVGVKGHPVPFATIDRTDPAPPTQGTGGAGLRSPTVTGREGWCGTKAVRDFTVASGAQVVTTQTGPECDAADLGVLRINAMGTVRVDGTIVADAVATTTNAQGNGGGGYGGAGGRGGGILTAYDGGPVGDLSAPGPGAAGGSRGKAAGGKGGGAVIVQARTVVVNGTISANGGRGIDGRTDRNDCADPGKDGTPGGGGGSGGAVAIDALQVTGNGEIRVRGGAGGAGTAGAGGGGGGGALFGTVPLWTNVRAVRAPGAAGNNVCTGPVVLDATPGERGDADLRELTRPASRAVAPSRLWFNKDRIALSFSAGAADRDGDGTFWVYVCGLRRDPSDLYDRLPDAGFAPSIPCGVNAHWLGSVQVSGTSAAPASIKLASPFNDELAQEGYWAIWTMADHGDTAPVDCPRRPNQPRTSCRFEKTPEQPDLVIGVDNTAPSVTVATDPPNATHTRSARVPIQVTARDVLLRDDGTPRDCAPSDTCARIAFVRCIDADGTTRTCGEDAHLNTAPTDGRHTMRVQAFDAALNSASFRVSLVLDRVAPDATHTVPPPTRNGWYSSTPTVTLKDACDPQANASCRRLGSGTAAAPRFLYSVDDGSEEPCASDPCTVTLPPLRTGRHVLRYTAVDEAGNRLFGALMKRVSLNVDAEKPVVAAAVSRQRSAPAGPVVVALRAVDQPSGSGPHVVTYHDGTRPGTFAVRGEFNVADGYGQTLCWSATDKAGVRSDDACHTFDVDLDEAPLSLSVPQPGPGGWHRGATAVTVSASQPDEVLTVRYAIDEDAWEPVTGGVVVVPEGRHRLRVVAKDPAGHETVRSTTLLSDGSAPSLVTRHAPKDPTQNAWWRRAPRLAVVADDGEIGSGVAAVEYRETSSSPWLPFREPLPFGARVPELRAVDAAGIERVLSPVSLKADIDPPVSAPLPSSGATWQVVPDALAGGKCMRAPGSPPPGTPLDYEVSDPTYAAAPGTVTSVVLVYDAKGNVVRALGPATLANIGALPQPFSVAWDGRNGAGNLVGPGSYRFRVVVTDESGHTAQSGESEATTVGGTPCL